MKKWITIFWFSALSMFITQPLLADDYTFAVAENTVDTIVSEVIIKKAYTILGHTISIIRLPPKRALNEASSGTLDGDVQRIYSVGHTYPNLIRIEPPINYIYGTGFVLKGSKVDVTTWEDLKKYRVGIILGIRFAETNVPKKNSFAYYSYKKLTEALNEGKIDIGIYPQSNGIYQTLLFGEKNIIPIKTPLSKFDLYHYVHKKNKHLVKDLTDIFRRFEKNGVLENVRQHVLDISFDRAKKGLEPCFKDYGCYQKIWKNE
ncbi:MAG: hypothetical protein V7750_14205 [Sneathiella sp.]